MSETVVIFLIAQTLGFAGIIVVAYIGLSRQLATLQETMRLTLIDAGRRETAHEVLSAQVQGLSRRVSVLDALQTRAHRFTDHPEVPNKT